MNRSVGKNLRASRFLLTSLLTLVSACSGKTQATATSGGSRGSGSGGNECLQVTDKSEGKIHHLQFLEEHASDAHSVLLSLGPWTNESCFPGETGCDPNDDALLKLQQSNQTDLDCVTATLIRDSKRPVVAAAWYRPVSFLTSGQIIPLGTAFTITASLDEVIALAQNPLVVAIDPAPGQGAGVPSTATKNFAACPDEAETVGSKLDEARAIQGMGRRPVVVDLRETILPAPIVCDGTSTCTEADNRAWERTIVNTRALTCVRRWIDMKLSAIPGPVEYASGSGSTTAPLLPPFGQSAATVSSQAMTLDWDEAQLVAGHPYVERIWTSPGLMQPQESACPPDLSTPIATKTCVSETEAGDGKFDAHNRQIFESTVDPLSVMLKIDGGATVCALDSCSREPCPSSTAVQERWVQENLESQKCVRDQIKSLGGASSPEAFWLTNSFTATLTWAHIQTVAMNPDVLRIESNLQ